MRSEFTVSPPATDERRRLQEFLSTVDPSLVESLRRDERRWRRKLVVYTITGGLIMGSVIATLAFLLLAQPGGVPAKQADQALALSNEGWQLWQQGKLDDAAAKFEQAAKLDPTNANALNGLGWAKFNAGDPDAAKSAFEQCLKAQPDHPAALNGLGQIAFAHRDYPAAERHWLACAKDAPAAQASLARLYLLQEKWDDAVKYAQLAAATPGADASVQQMLTAAKARHLDPQLKSQLEPPADSGSLMRGWAMLNQGQPNQAREFFEAALKKNPDDPDAHNALGFTLINLGKPADAKPHFEAALKHQPDAGGPTNGLAICLKAEGKVDEAIKLWEKMAQQPPTPNAATSGLAMTFYERKEYAKAIPYLEQLAQQAAPENAQLKQMLEQARSQK